ncbi:MAG: M48 family metallopeptidase [Dehalococcoidia bacterium]|nr:M48 family metallopeptidase [Dehalococcoidia bacterium]
MWEQIRSNRVRSIVLVAGMCVLLLALGYVIGLFFLDNPFIGLIIAGSVWALLALVSFFQGDNILLSVSKARKIGREDDPQLYNVVEEMTIASGLEKIPDIYVINDNALNAFATGRSPKKAAVTITSGLRSTLNRNELQGVIAHEIGHIKNRDVLLMCITSVMLGAIVIISWYTTRVLFWGGAGRKSNSSRGEGSGAFILLIIGLLLMVLAPIFAQLINYAVSRKREYLADASAALYTRYPEGLASALEKIGSSTTAVKSANKATAPMFIVNPFAKRKAFNEWMSTHPPIADRVRVLRSMNGYSISDYEESFTETHKGKHIFNNPMASDKM